MAISDDEARSLRIAIEDLNRAVREQNDTSRRSSTNSAGEAIGRAAGREIAARGGPTGGGKSSDVFGYGLSAARQVLSAGGPAGSAIGNVLGATASGGPLAGLAAAAGEVGSTALQYLNAGASGARNAPLFAGRGRQAFEGGFARSNFADEKLSGLDVGGSGLGAARFLSPFAFLFDQAQGANQRIRGREEERARRVGPVDATSSQLGSFIGEIAAAGGNVSDSQIEQLGKRLLAQNRARQAAQERTTGIVNKLGGFDADQNTVDQHR